MQVNKQTVGEKKLQRTQTIITHINEADKLLLKYNSPNIYSGILQKTYRDYCQIAEQSTITETEFIESNTDRIILNAENNLPFQKSDKEKFNYGVIVFCPHKTSEFGSGNLCSAITISKR